MNKITITLTMMLALISVPAAAGEPGDLAASLARLRGEVEDIAGEIEAQKTDQQARIRSLAAQRAELEVQLKREQLRLQQLDQQHTEHRARVEQINQRKERLSPVVPRLVRQLEQALGQSLPFRLAERAKAPGQLLERFQNKMVDVDAVVAQLWEQVEDELRLGQESGLYTQTLIIDGAEQLVEVARVGMALLFFCTSEGRYGIVRRESGSWRAVTLLDRDEQRQVNALFDAFKRQIRTGFFHLPSGGGALEIESAR